MSTNQIATYTNAKLGIAATVTKISKGYAVSLIDTDAEKLVGGRVYPEARLEEALAYAKGLAA